MTSSHDSRNIIGHLDKPESAKAIIDLLNEKSYEELQDLGIRDRTKVIIEANKVINKKVLAQNVQELGIQLSRDGGSFKAMFTDLIKHGLPPIWDDNRDLYPKEHYNAFLIVVRNPEVNFADVGGQLEGKTVFEKLHEDFELLVELQTVFKALPKPSYEHYTELDVALREMKVFQYPMGKDWKNITRFLALRQ